MMNGGYGVPTSQFDAAKVFRGLVEGADVSALKLSPDVAQVIGRSLPSADDVAGLKKKTAVGFGMSRLHALDARAALAASREAGLQRVATAIQGLEAAGFHAQASALLAVPFEGAYQTEANFGRIARV